MSPRGLGGDRQGGPLEVAACVVEAVDRVPLGLGRALGQVDADQPVDLVVGVVGDVLGPRAIGAAGVEGARADQLAAVADRVVGQPGGDGGRGRRVERLGDLDGQVALVVGQRGGVVVGVGGGVDVAVGVVVAALPVAERVGGGQGPVGRVVVVGGGEGDPGQRAVARAGDGGHIRVGLGDRAQVAGQVVAGVGSARAGDRAGAVDLVLGLAQHPVQGVVGVEGGEVLVEVGRAAGRHALGAGHLDRAAGLVVVDRGLLALGVGRQRRLVHGVVGDGAGRPDPGVAGAVARPDLLDQVVAWVVGGAGPDQLAAVEAGRLGGALAAEPVEAVVVEVAPVAAGVAAGVGGVQGVLQPFEQPVGVVVGLGDLVLGVGDPGRLAARVVGVVGGLMAVGVGGRGERAVGVPVVGGGVAFGVGDGLEVACGVCGVVAEGPLVVVGHAGGGHALGAGHGRQQRQVVADIGGVHRGGGVGQLGAFDPLGDLVLPGGQVAVGVVGVGGGEVVGHGRGGDPLGFGDLADLEVAGPLHLGGLAQRVGELGDLAVGVVGVAGHPRRRQRRRGHRGHPAGRVVGEAGGVRVGIQAAVLGGVADPVGAGLELPPELRAVAGAEVGEGGLGAVGPGRDPARVAHAEQPRGLVGRARLGVHPQGRVGDRRAITGAGGVGEHQRPVGQEAAVGVGAAPLGQAPQVAVVVVVEVQRTAVVVGDPLDLAAHVRLLGLVAGPVVDGEVPVGHPGHPRGVGHPDDALLGAARVLARRGVLQGEADGVVVAVDHGGGEPVGVEVEGDLVGAGQRPAPLVRVGGDAAQVQVDPGRFSPAGRPVRLGGPGEAVGGAVAVDELHPLVAAVVADVVGLVGVDVQRLPQPGQPRDRQGDVVADGALGVVLQRVVGQVHHGRQAPARREQRRPAPQQVAVGHIGQRGHAGARVLAVVVPEPLQPQLVLKALGHQDGMVDRWVALARKPAGGGHVVQVDAQPVGAQLRAGRQRRRLDHQREVLHRAGGEVVGEAVVGGALEQGRAVGRVPAVPHPQVQPRVVPPVHPALVPIVTVGQ
jgi:hypothetical protein